MMKRFPDYAKVLEPATARRCGSVLVELFPSTASDSRLLLVRNWGLFWDTGQAIRFHHEEDAYDPRIAAVRRCPRSSRSRTFTKHLFAEIKGGTRPGLVKLLFPAGAGSLGISPDDLDTIRTMVAQVSKIMPELG